MSTRSSVPALKGSFASEPNVGQVVNLSGRVRGFIRLELDLIPSAIKNRMNETEFNKLAT